MAASKDLLSDILDGISVFQVFLTRDLSSEALSPKCSAQLQNVYKIIEDLINKINRAHPSIRPRMNTPGTMKKPAPPPPSHSPVFLPEEDNEEVYEEPVPEEPQEMYEAMEGAGEEQDVYEEPVPVLDIPQDDGENYEEPINSRPSTASLPPPSQENSGSGAEYAEAFLKKPGGQESPIEMSTDWGSVYTMPQKGEKTKVSALKNIVIKGYLEKLGGRSHKTWQRRYCVLAGPLLYFYEKESSKTYNNCVVMFTFTISLADNVTNEKKKQFGFKLSHIDATTGKNKDYYFRANSIDVRDKWISSIGKVLASSATPVTSHSATLPPQKNTFKVERNRASSMGTIDDEGGELYEDMGATGNIEEEQEEYVAVSPVAEENDNLELDSAEEYVDVIPQDELEQEQYEDTTNFHQPPPPSSLPPGPPSEVFTSPPLPNLPNPVPLPHPGPFKAPAPPPVNENVDTSRVYTQPGNDLHLEKVFVSLWDFIAGEKDELTLRRGDLVYVSDPRNSDEWWYGELLDREASRKLGQAGFFPRNYSTTAFEPVT